MRKYFSQSVLAIFSLIVFLSSANIALAAYSYSKAPKIDLTSSNAKTTVYIKTDKIGEQFQVIFSTGNNLGNLCDGGTWLTNESKLVTVSCNLVKNQTYKVTLYKTGTVSLISREKIQELPTISTYPPQKTTTINTNTQPSTQNTNQTVNTTTGWYFNTGKQIQGPFNNPGACETARDKYIKDNGITTGSIDICSQKTVSEIQTIINEQKNTPTPISPEQTPSSSNKIYNLLAPIGGLKCVDSTGTDKACVDGGVGGYLNTIFLIAIGICGVLAVVMLVINFIGYMSSESFTEKASFKQKLWGPIGGLLLALGAYAILNTVNPALTGKEGLTVKSVGVVVKDFEDMPEGGDLSEPIYITAGISGGGIPITTPGVTCASGSVTQGFCMIGDYNNPKPTGEIPQLIKLLKSEPGYKITRINIVPTGEGEKFIFIVTKGSDTKKFSTMGIGHGSNGWSNGNGYSGDSRTPYGTFTIINKDKAENQNTVLRSTRKDKKTGLGYSMGGAKFNLNSRGIAIHSNRKNSKGTTAACILMHNDDLFALYPYIYNGLKVVIGP